MNTRQETAGEKPVTAEGIPNIETTATRMIHKSQPVSDRPIYTVPRDTLEYQKRRQEQYERGLENLLEAICIFGGAFVLYFVLRWIF